MKRYVVFGRSHLPDIPEKGFLAGQGSSHHMNFHLRQSLGEFENPVRSLYAADIADPQHVDIAGGGQLHLLDQHSGDPTRQSVAARQSLSLRSALHENGIGPSQAIGVKPAIARKTYEQSGPITVRITCSAEDQSPAKTPAKQS